MRVGIYDPYLDDVGGGEKYMLTIAEYLSKSNDVEVFWDGKEDLELAKKRFSLDLKNVKVHKNIFAQKVSFVEKISTSRKFDIIIVLSDGSIPLLLSKKLFLHIQRPLEHVRPNLLSRLKLSRVTAIFCNSQFTKSFIDKTFNIDSEIIYPPVEFHPQKVKKENIILHVGRFRVFDKTVGLGDYKKQNFMIEVFKEMIDTGLAGWQFVIAVSVQEKDTKSFEEMKQKAKGYPVVFQVNKTNRELWNYYSKAKIYWHASGYGEDLSKHPEYAEHFGIATVEAMGAGAVPVVIEAGGQTEIVKNGKSGLLWKTKDEFIEQTRKVIADEKLRAMLSHNAISESQTFSKEAFCQNIEKLIHGK